MKRKVIVHYVSFILYLQNASKKEVTYVNVSQKYIYYSYLEYNRYQRAVNETDDYEYISYMGYFCKQNDWGPPPPQCN